MTKFLTYTSFLVIALFVIAPNTYAKSPVDVQLSHKDKLKKMQEERCKKKEVATIAIRLTGSGNSFKELSAYVDKVRSDMVEQGSLLGVSDLTSRNENFSIRSVNNYRSNGNNDKYNLTGNINFESKMVVEALDLAEAMSEMDYNTSYTQNVSQQRCY